MDFSKIKKILIILCIACVLLSIISKFQKVFAANNSYYDIELNNNESYQLNLPDFITNQYFLIYYSNSSDIGCSFKVYYSSSPFYFYRSGIANGGLLRNIDNTNFTYVYQTSWNYGDNNDYIISRISPFSSIDSSDIIQNNNYQYSISALQLTVTQLKQYGTFYSNYDVLDSNNNVIIDADLPTPAISYPELLNNSLTLENLSLQSYNISAGDYEDITFYALFYDRSILSEENFWDFPQVVIELSPDNEYWLQGDTVQKYRIPVTDVPLTYKSDTTYSIAFATKQFSSSGGGFRGDDFTWEFLGSPRSWTTLPASAINTDLDNLNSQTDKQNLINYQNNVTNNLTNINDSLTNTDITDSDDALAESGVITEDNEDITATGFDNIFNMFYNGITSNPVNIVLPIPFTNKTIIIEPNYIRNALGNQNILLNLIESFWYFAVSLYIVKDIQKVIEKIKSGDITSSSDTNIKADML